eukprot:Gb_39112 [translate_table: standard]
MLGSTVRWFLILFPFLYANLWVNIPGAQLEGFYKGFKILISNKIGVHFPWFMLQLPLCLSLFIWIHVEVAFRRSPAMSLQVGCCSSLSERTLNF